MYVRGSKTDKPATAKKVGTNPDQQEAKQTDEDGKHARPIVRGGQEHSY